MHVYERIIHYHASFLLTAGAIGLWLVKNGLVDTIGESSVELVQISGTDQSDGVYELRGAQALLGIDNDFYDAEGVAIQMSWVDLQTVADASEYLFVGRRGGVLYDVDMSASETAIMRYLGGLYVLPEIEYLYTPDGNILVSPDGIQLEEI